MVETIDNSQYVNFPLAVEVRAYDGADIPRQAEECVIAVYDISGNVMDIIQPIDPEDICTEVNTGFLSDRKAFARNCFKR